MRIGSGAGGSASGMDNLSSKEKKKKKLCRQ
jgi:hypothetical protein